MKNTSKRGPTKNINLKKKIIIINKDSQWGNLIYICTLILSITADSTDLPFPCWVCAVAVLQDLLEGQLEIYAELVQTFSMGVLVGLPWTQLWMIIRQKRQCHKSSLWTRKHKALHSSWLSIHSHCRIHNLANPKAKLLVKYAVFI